MRHAPRVLVATAALLALGAGGVVGEGVLRGKRVAASSREFQRLVGGLGLRPRASLSGCEAAFDPRVGAVCVRRLEPIPGGEAFSRDAVRGDLPR